jgi:WhiB family redox-sensing transcriptional regulator
MNPTPDWHLRAACRGKDTGLFFTTSKKKLAVARSMCAGCPVRRDCLESSLREDEAYRLIPCGYRGGAAPEERKAMLLARATTNTTTRSAA